MTDGRGAVSLIPAGMAVRVAVAHVVSVYAVAVPAVNHAMDAF